jgi:hypothetical protein
MPEGRLDSQNCTGSLSVAGHSAGSHRSGSSAPLVAWRISRPAGRMRRATKREYMRLKPLRPVPGREPSLPSITPTYRGHQPTRVTIYRANVA